jgi:polysaccharide pyruvyl transferase WcaK-like protein
VKKNILFSTTRQWNPGDEFILLGVINLLREILGDFNSIIYNRSPEVRQVKGYLNPFRTIEWTNRSFSGKKNIEAFFRMGFYDNSFKENIDASFINYVVFAGSPEWMGRRSSPLYDVILRYEIPTIYLGIGSSNIIRYDMIKERYRRVLESSRLIIVRDEVTREILKPLNPVKLSCPALFAAKEEKESPVLQKIALIFATHKAVRSNRVSQETSAYLVSLYGALLKSYECEIVCHYIDELPEAFHLFPGRQMHYSYDSKDYLEIYRKFDFVMGPRIHGIGICASCGIPGILISHDLRADTAQGFGAKIIPTGTDIPEVISLIEESRKSLRQSKEALRRLKMDMKTEYLRILRKVL